MTRLPTVLALTLLGLALASAANAQALAPGAFDLSAPITTYGLLTHRQLAEHNVMQSFAFDEVNKTIIVIQTRRGHRADGGLLANRFTYAGRRLDTMTLDNFGHGTSLGVTHAGATTFLWLESVAKANDHGTSAGTRVSRIPYRPNGSASPGSAGSVDVTPPQAAGHDPVPQIDPVTGNLVVRINVGSLWRFLSVPQADAVAHRWNRVRVLGQTPSAGSASPQGYAVAGGFAYLNYGTAGKLNGYIRKVSLNPRATTSGPSTPVRVFPTVESREPEGITVQQGAGGGPRLALGVGSRAGDDVTFFNMAYAGRYVVAPAAARPPAANPAPAVPAVLSVSAVRISRKAFLKTHRIPVRVGGVDAVARVRILARYKRRGHRSRVVSIYSGQRRVRAGSRTIGLKLTKRQFRRLRAVRGRTRLAIAVRAAGQKRTVHETVPRPARRKR